MLGVATLFLVANRGAYRSFFSDDDLDNLSQGRQVDLLYYGKRLLSPKFGGETNFRPTAALYYYVMPRTFGLRFPPYIAVIHALHLLNMLLVWFVARSLRAPPLGASAAALLFAFHMGTFSVYWAPMYVFDLVCGTCILLSLLTYVNGRLFLSVVFFWLALKSKESAILFPLALAAYDFWIGGKQWKRLIPFFAISAAAGAEALFFNAHRNNAYSLVFGRDAVDVTARFYAANLTLLPQSAAMFAVFLILAILAISFAISNRLTRFGALTFVVMLAPLLFLPGRLFGAYLYVPLIGLAIAISAVSRPVWLAVFFVLWVPWNYRMMRIDRNNELHAADERRSWFAPVAEFSRLHPAPTTFVYTGAPESLQPHGIAGALSALHSPDASISVVAADAPEARTALAAPDVVVLAWNGQTTAVVPRAADEPYVRLNSTSPLWQLGDGWIDGGGTARWIGAHATARLAAMPGATSFELVVHVAPVYIERLHEGRIEVSLNHQHVGTAWMREAGATTYHFPVPAGLASPVEVEFDVNPPLKDPNGSATVYGAPIAGFGFVSGIVKY